MAARAQTNTSDTTGLVYYDFGASRADGAFPLRIRTDHRAKTTINGHAVKPPSGDAATYVWQKDDGTQLSQDGRYAGAYSNGDLGLLPHLPVQIGARWTDTLSDQGLFSARGLPCVSTLVGMSHPGGHALVGVETVCSEQGQTSRHENGQTFHIEGTDTLTGEWTFDVTTGRFISQLLNKNIDLHGTVIDHHRSQPYNEHDTQRIVQVYAGVLGPGGMVS